MKYIFLIFILPSVFRAEAGEQSIACSNGLIVNVFYSETVRTFSYFDNFEFNNKLPIIKGGIEVINPFSESKRFSTVNLKGKFGNSEFVRTYKSTVASEVIDFAAVDITKNSTLKLNVYWVPGLKIKDKPKEVSFLCE